MTAVPDVTPGQDAPAVTVPEVIARMEQIDASTVPRDGVACFNRMYLEVTRKVEQGLGQGFFAGPEFMTRLDVTFANLYFAAVDAAADPAEVPLAWRPLLQARAERGIEPIQFALAGMNAHINHDLPVAVVSTCAVLGTEPTAGSHLADYQKVDRLLDAAEQSVRESFESAVERAVDQHLRAVENLVCGWSINEARDLAWTNAQLLWSLRDDQAASDLAAGAIAAAAAMASKLLLVAV